jgi:hypothetical protein
MAKRLSWAIVRVPEQPRARFFVRVPNPKPLFRDVTCDVSKLVIEDLEDDSGSCALLRLNADDTLVWTTKHPSLQETKWHVEFEYGLPEEKWLPYENNGPHVKLR